MQTRFDALAAPASTLEAANEELAIISVDRGKARRDGGASGWDPYEVWRVRIKEAQECFTRLPRPPLK